MTVLAAPRTDATTQNVEAKTNAKSPFMRALARMPRSSNASEGVTAGETRQRLAPPSSEVISFLTCERKIKRMQSAITATQIFIHTPKMARKAYCEMPGESMKK